MIEDGDADRMRYALLSFFVKNGKIFPRTLAIYGGMVYNVNW